MNYILLIIGVLFLHINLFSKEKAHKLSTSTKVYSSYNEIGIPKEATHILSYDNQVVGEGIGTNSAFTMEMLIEFPSDSIEHLIGENITHIRYGVEEYNTIQSAELRIYENDMATPVYTQTIAIETIFQGYNLLELDQAYSINENTSVFMGVYFSTQNAAYLGTIDTDGIQAPNYGGHVWFNEEYIGTLAQNGIDGDWNLQAVITNDGIYNGIKDLALIGAHVQSSNCMLSDSSEIMVSIANFGDSIINESVDLNANLNGSTFVLSVLIDSLNPKDTLVYVMPPMNLSTLGVYHLNLELDFVDVFQENNFLNTSFTSGDAVITINFQTDGNPEETSWLIKDKYNKTIASNKALEAFTSYSLNVCVLSDNCYTFSIYDTYGDGLFDEDFPGNFSIVYNNDTIAHSPADGNFGFEFNTPTMGNGCPINNIAIEDHFLPTEAPMGEVPLFFEIKNMGSDHLNSFDLQYIIDNNDTITQHFTSLLLETNETLLLKSANALNFSENKIYSIEISLLNPNNQADEIPENNTTFFEINIHSNIAFKKQLIEYFSDSNLDSCAQMNEHLSSFLTNYQNKYTLINYPTYFTEPGDPFYIPDSDERAWYYNIEFAPSVFQNGKPTSQLSATAFELENLLTSDIKLELSADYYQENIRVNGTIKALKKLPTGLIAHIAIIENSAIGNPNESTERFNTLYAMLPSVFGTVLESVEAGESVLLSESYSMSETFAEDMSNLTAILFIQNENNDEILQSIAVPIEKQETIELTFNVDMNNAIAENIFNPTLNEVYVTGSFAQGEFDWDEPGSGNSLLLNSNDASTIYSGTIEVLANTLHEYKYFINEGWQNPEWHGAPNRSITVTDNDTAIIPTDVFGVQPVNINQNVLNEVSVSPNPFNKNIKINNLKENSKIRISDTSGKIVFEKYTQSNAIEINTKELEDGIYFVKVYNPHSNIRTFKIIKN